MTKEQDLEKFYDNIEYISKDLAKYEDDLGNIVMLNTMGLYCNVEFQRLEINEKNLKVLKFDGIISDDAEVKPVKFITKVDKSTITNKESDKFTIVDKEFDICELYVVSNGMKVTKTYLDKEEALAFANKINNQINELFA